MEEVHARETAEALVGAATGPPVAPQTLLLSRYADTGRLHYTARHAPRPSPARPAKPSVSSSLPPRPGTPGRGGRSPRDGEVNELRTSLWWCRSWWPRSTQGLHPGVVLVGDGVTGGGAGVGQCCEGGADGWEGGQVGSLAVVDPFNDSDFVAAVGQFVQFLLGKGLAGFGGDVEAVYQVELARRRGQARAADALVDDPQQIAAVGLVDVQVESLGEFAWAEVFSIFDVATGRGVVGGIGAVAADEGNVVAAENDGPGADLDPGERDRRLVGSTGRDGPAFCGSSSRSRVQSPLPSMDFSTLALCA